MHVFSEEARFPLSNGSIRIVQFVTLKAAISHCSEEHVDVKDSVLLLSSASITTREAGTYSETGKIMAEATVMVITMTFNIQTRGYVTFDINLFYTLKKNTRDRL